MTPLIEVVAVTYKQPGPLAVFVQCFLNQTADNWKLSVWHDGPDDEFHALMAMYVDTRITHRSTATRCNDWGHSLRAEGLREAASDYVLLTNADNYYVPRFIEAMNAAVQSGPDMVLFDMVHSYAKSVNGKPITLPYTVLQPQLRAGAIDMGCAIVRTSLAKATGFRGRERGADWTYFDDLTRDRELAVAKVDSVLFVHN